MILLYRLYRCRLRRHRIRHQQVEFRRFLFDVAMHGDERSRTNDIYLTLHFISPNLDVVVANVVCVCVAADVTAAAS